MRSCGMPSACRSIARSGAIPVPPAMNANRDSDGAAGNVNDPTGPSTSTRSPGEGVKIQSVFSGSCVPPSSGVPTSRSMTPDRFASSGADAIENGRRSAMPGGPARPAWRSAERNPWSTATRTSFARGVAASTSRIVNVNGSTLKEEVSSNNNKTRETRDLMKRLRGALLRFVRRRALCAVAGIALIAPAAWIEFVAKVDQWWVEGLALVVGATGLALVWTAIVGVAPDWLDD